MKLPARNSVITAALLVALAPSIAHSASPAAADTRTAARNASKNAREHQREQIAAGVERLRASGADRATIQKYLEEQRELAAPAVRTRGSSAAAGAHSPTAVPASGAQLLVTPVCGGAPTTTINVAGSTGPITPPNTSAVQFTTTVSGAGTYLWDLVLTTSITHTFTSDLVVELTSPAGTTVMVSSNNGGGLDNVYNGTTWDDDGVNAPCTDFAYTNNVTATPVNPEGRFAGFRGEDPNGTWTLTITDIDNPDAGNLSAWSLDVVTLASAPVETTTTLTQSPNLAISASGTPTVTDSIVAAGLGTNLTGVKLYVEIPHTWSSDLDVTLTSPAGTVVKVTTDNGEDFFAGFVDVFDGSLFDPAVTAPVTDVFFQDFVAATPISPEGSFDNFRGQNPNGSWTLTVVDDTNLDGGTLVRWDLTLITAAAPTPSAPANFAGTTGAIPDFAPTVTVPTIYTALVAGAGSYLWDLDTTTTIADTFPADLRITLTSPAGTTIVLSTVNGGGNDNVFNGTLWDDDANDPVTTHTYANAVLASPLAPEGRLSAFRGEDPNGTWTLTITDNFLADNGDLNGWSLDVTTLAAAPTQTPTVFSQSPALAISSAGTPTVTDSMVVSGLATFLGSVEVYVEIPHTFAEDLDVTLTSPGGTTIVLTADNGLGNDNVFNGTLFTGTSADSPTDHVYTNLVVAAVLGSQGPLDAFAGQDPNGSWTLTVTDDTNLDGGTLARWDLTLKTCDSAGSAFCTNGSLGVDHTTACPCGNTGAPGNGCGHSFDANGANMSATGSSAADTVVLHSQFEPVSSFTLMMQHANAGDSIFHDGVLCAANPLIRLRGRSAVAGEAFFPNSNFAQDSTTTLSIRGGTFPGSGATMRYAAWYRNASSTFCPPATANVTNGWVITW